VAQSDRPLLDPAQKAIALFLTIANYSKTFFLKTIINSPELQ
jgi:hypothetical protein